MKKFIAMTVLAAFTCGALALPLAIETEKPKACEKCKDCKEDCKCACHKKDEKK